MPPKAMLILGIILILIGGACVAYWKLQTFENTNTKNLYTTLADIEKDPAKYDGMKVTLVGTYKIGSVPNTINDKIWDVTLDDKIWIETLSETIFTPPNMFNGLIPIPHNVRVVGVLHTNDQNGYGHNAAYPYQIDAESVTLLSDDPITPSNINNTDRDKAIQIAEQELLKHYPDHTRNGAQLSLDRAEPVAGSTSKWYVHYDVPEYGPDDSGVELIVDISTGEIVSYRDSWS